MKSADKNKWLLPLIAGILTFVAVNKVSFILGWLCFVPLFMVTNNHSAKASFRSGFIFGLSISACSFYWMISGAETFTGYSILYGVAVFLISCLFLSLYFAGVNFCYTALKIKGTANYIIAGNATLAGFVYCAGEALLMQVSTGFPWFDFHAGNALADNLYAIQPAAYFGIYIMTFVIILVNYLIAFFISNRQWLRLFFPAAVIGVYILSGGLLLQKFENNLQPGKSFEVAILSENILPDIKWDDANGNMLVQKLLDLNKASVSLKPAIALWSESAIPWTYSANDDLVKEVSHITSPAGITHIMGINTEISDTEIFNSAYCILPGGTVTGRYDKQHLLSLIEKPLSGILFPFFSSKGFVIKENPEHNKPLNTPNGKAGIMICNESAIPAAGQSMAINGAEFIFNMSNDGWFSKTYIVDLHFYNARLRAVETRKDIVVNSNNGFSGLIQASGKIIMQERSEGPYVKKVTVQPNSYKSIATDNPFLFIYFCIIYIAAFLFRRIFYKNP